MAYEDNTVNWDIGALVIHKADAKTRKMLMVVVGIDFQKDLIKTCYVDGRKGVWLNDKKFLLDPKQFNLPTTPEEYRKREKC